MHASSDRRLTSVGRCLNSFPSDKRLLPFKLNCRTLYDAGNRDFLHSSIGLLNRIFRSDLLVQ
ncbi:protein of unknown function [Nocardia cyriacigeorgica GUH-2]|uniref:Uncharacterized protein n=1 Tax=Nocardia cyriacigeorgica (strain GUH-2) TaxID=1127134 RepID=H6RA94_NOCCG|nr:protein of unknown function [Nocardia cyriacigeorgica GUH-2]